MIITILMATVVLTGCVSSQEQVVDEHEKNTGDTPTEKGDQLLEENKEPLTETRALEIEAAFFDQLYTPETVGKTNEIKAYQSKKALIEATLAIASRELVTQLVDDYYREEEGLLYVVPKDGPAKLLSDSPMLINRVDEDTYQVSQQNETELRGPYILTVEFSWMDDAWKMTDRIFEVDN
ncbi:hypothetical protein [Halolactibacillus halophilus]|nr:hypothetical protein [Halolactibacillus halophilus]